jgi:hypothetical protein
MTRGERLTVGEEGIAYRPAARGLAPLDGQGCPIELHLRSGDPQESVDEMTVEQHRGATNYGQHHGRSNGSDALHVQPERGGLAPCSRPEDPSLLYHRFTAAAQQLREHAPPNCLGTGATGHEMSECERQLGVLLPASYKWLLQEFGFVHWPDYIYGVGDRLLPGLSLCWKVWQEREQLWPRMPRHLVPISPDGWGNHYCLDTSQLAEEECPVVFWSHERGEDQEPERTHSSFLTWLEDGVRQAQSAGE